jgi:hypothetical protein
VPGDDIERRMISLAGPQIPAKFGHDLAFFVPVLVPRGRRLEIAGVRQTVSPDRPKIGQTKLRAVIFTNVTARD